MLRFIVYIVFSQLSASLVDSHSNNNKSHSLQCFDGHNVAKNCYACFYTRIANEAKKFHCEETETSARQLMLYMSSISTFEIPLNDKPYIGCIEPVEDENQFDASFRICSCQFDLCNRDYDTCCDSFKTTTAIIPVTTTTITSTTATTTTMTTTTMTTTTMTTTTMTTTTNTMVTTIITSTTSATTTTTTMRNNVTIKHPVILTTNNRYKSVNLPDKSKSNESDVRLKTFWDILLNYIFKVLLMTYYYLKAIHDYLIT